MCNYIAFSVQFFMMIGYPCVTVTSSDTLRIVIDFEVLSIYAVTSTLWNAQFVILSNDIVAITYVCIYVPY